MAGAGVIAVNQIVASQYNSTMEAVSYSMRSLVKAAPGHRLMAVDYSNIEGRMLAFLAGEHWKLQAFRDYDAGTGPDLYKVAAGRILGIDPGMVSKTQRQLIGKPAELGLGYGGGPGAILTMMKNGAVIPWLRRDGPAPKKITLDDISGAVREAVSPMIWAEAGSMYAAGAMETAAEILAHRQQEIREADPENYVDYEATRDRLAKVRYLAQRGATEGERAAAQAAAERLMETLRDAPPVLADLASELARKNRLGLAPAHWTALRVIVDLWRQSNTNISKFWRALEDAAISAIENPGTVYAAGLHIKYVMSGDLLRCRLPSGRLITYPYARILRPEQQEQPKGEPNAIVIARKSKRIIYEGVDSYSRRWGVQQVYGGLLSENVTQAAARDKLRDAILRLRRHLYKIVLHVHDEIVCEMPLGHGSLEEMSALMKQAEPWEIGCPISTDGWEGRRYRK